MATNFSDILSDYDEMSFEELGTSLLARQEEQRKRAAKTSRKSQKVQQALGVLLATQGLFKSQFNKRQKELKELKTLDLLNTENTAKKLRSVSSFVNVIPENFEADKPLEERVNSFMNNPELYNQFKVNSKPLIDSYLQSVFSNNPDFQNSTEYSAISRYGNKQLISNLLENNNYQTFVNELAELEPGEMTREDLLKKYIRISPERFTQQRTRQYQLIENELKNKAGFIEGIKGIVQKVSKDKSKKGELDLYSRLTSEDITGNDLNTILDKLDIGGLLIPEINKAIAQTEAADIKYKNIMTTARGNEVIARLQQDFKNLKVNVSEPLFEKDKLLNTQGLLDEVEINKLGEVFNFVENLDDETKTKVFTDAGALALRFQDEPQFAIDIYKTITDDPNKINRFKNRIKDTAFRNQYAIMMTLKMGVKGQGTIFTGGQRGFTKYTGYDANPMTLMLGDVFEVENGNFQPTTEYYFLDDDEQKMMVDKKIRSILKLGISQDAKQKTIDNFFANIDVPGFTNQEDYFNSLIN